MLSSSVITFALQAINPTGGLCQLPSMHIPIILLEMGMKSSSESEDLVDLM